MTVSSTTDNSRLAMCTKPMSVRKSVGLESTGFAAAELASMGVSLGVVAIADDLIPKSIMKNITHHVAAVCIEPHLDSIEKIIAKCHLKECQPDETKSREERAERLARGLIVFSTAYIVSLGAKLGVRRAANNKLGVAGERHITADENVGFIKRKIHGMNPMNWAPDERLIFAADEVAHLGSLVLLNTKASDVTDRNIDTMSHALQKIGVKADRAKDISTMAMVWEVPNFLGMAAGTAAIFGKHAYGWPKEHKYQKFAEVLSGKAASVSHSHTS